MLICTRSSSKMNVYIWMLLCISFAGAENCKREKRCRVSRIYRMKSADCVDREIRDFPQCLPTDIEIIDLSLNRIRKLGRDDLKRYSNLKMLYLSDNVVMFIDDEAFEGQEDLTTLDLSLNAFSMLPPVVFNLPSLSSLYLGQNMNINIAEVVKEAKTVTSPLVQLDISYVITESASELPEFGMLPFLTKYNISGNKLSSIGTRHFAGLCSLKTLYNANVTIEEESCDCWALNRWLRSRKVQFKLFECGKREDECSDDVPANDLQSFKECNEDREAFNRKNRTLKGFYISLGVIIPIFLIVLIYFIIRRRKTQSRRQLRNEQAPDESALYSNHKIKCDNST